MPRETINSRNDFNVKVGWGSGLVQVGVETPNNTSIFWKLFGTDHELMVAIGDHMEKSVRYLKENNVGGDDVNTYHAALAVELLNQCDVMTPLYAGVWSDLDRQGCNQLIRILRKARDASYGRDE